MNELKKAIFETRRSIRRFEERQISNVDLHEILSAAQMAASAMNEQAWFFAVIQNEEILDEIGKFATDGIGTPYYGAPTMIACFANDDAIAPVVDCTLAMANMMYAAISCDLGTCWVDCTKDVFNNPQYAQLKKACGVPNGYTCIGSLIVGYPHGEANTPKPRKQDVFSIIR